MGSDQCIYTHVTNTQNSISLTPEKSLLPLLSQSLPNPLLTSLIMDSSDLSRISYT